MAKTGRPKIDIDQNTFEKLCALFCTEEDIADFFECSVDTINRWCKRTYGTTFADIYPKKRARGKISLRRWQMESAQKGNASMQIFLGKQYLGQRDQLDTTAPETAINISVSAASPEDIGND